MSLYLNDIYVYSQYLIKSTQEINTSIYKV